MSFGSGVTDLQEVAVIGLQEAAVVAGALAVAVALAGIGAGMGVLAGVALVAGVGLAGVVPAGIVAIGVALAGSIAVGAAAAVLGKRPTGQPGRYAGVLGPAIAMPFFTISPFGSQLGDPLFVVLITFILVLPVVNGLWDFGSWWVSRSLGRHLLTKLKGSSPIGGKAWAIFWHIALDLVVAALALLSLACFLGFAFQSYQNTDVWWSGRERGTLALPAYIDIASAAPLNDGLWLTAMLVSTLIPTFLHGVIVIAGALGLFVPVTTDRLKLADGLETLNNLGEQQRKLVLQRAGRYFANGRPALWALATLLLLILLVLISAALAAIHLGGFANYIATAAHVGVDFSNWLLGAAV